MAEDRKEDISAIAKKIASTAETELSEYREAFKKIAGTSHHKGILESMNSSRILAESLKEIVGAHDHTSKLLRESLKLGSSSTLTSLAGLVHPSWIDEHTTPSASLADMLLRVTTGFSGIAQSLTAAESIYQAFDVQKFNLSVPNFNIDSILRDQEQLNKTFHQMIDVVNKPSDLMLLPHSAITGASREIFTSSNALRTLIPEKSEVVVFDIRDVTERTKKEVSNCSLLLASVNPGLVPMYEGAIATLNNNSPDKSRQVLVSLRQLSEQVLNSLAPTKEVISWVDQKQKGYLDKYGNPLRKTRVSYIFRNIDQGNQIFHNLVEQDASSFDTLFELFNGLHRTNPNLNDDQLRALILRVESWITYIIMVKREIP